jgi:hypothetical protein
LKPRRLSYEYAAADGMLRSGVGGVLLSAPFDAVSGSGHVGSQRETIGAPDLGPAVDQWLR